MGLIKEPINVDFTGQSKPRTEIELRDFRQLMNKLKEKNASKKTGSASVTKKKVMA